VRLAVNGRSEVLFHGRPGGGIFTPEELYDLLCAKGAGRDLVGL
jgi:hypothetical protein